MSDLKEYRITIVPALEASHIASMEPIEYATLDEVKAGILAVSLTLLFIQDNLKIMIDYSNMFLIEKLNNGSWEEFEYDDDEGDI